ncbi:MAG: class I SAM-dependent methyltransferase [Burkholderiales bacterium]
MRGYYPATYGPHLATRVPTSDPDRGNAFARFLRAVVRRIFDAKATILPEMPAGRMLEFGCASGAYLYQMAAEGWKVEGIEVSQAAAAEVARLGFPIHSGSIGSAQPTLLPFDLIVGWMALEHLHDPLADLRRLYDWAQPDCVLALSVPNAASFEFRLFESKWYALQLPTHLYHFTPQSLRVLLNAAGWTVERVHYQRTISNVIGSLGYLLADRGYTRLARRLVEAPESGGLWVYLAHPIAVLLSLFGQTGRMTIWARKSGSTSGA